MTPAANENPEKTYMEWNYFKPWCRYSPYIFGILLGFPAIFHCDQEEGNCLDNVDLALYKVQVDNFSPISFSVPASLERAASDQISSWETEAAERCETESGLRVTRQIVNLAVVVL